MFKSICKEYKILISDLILGNSSPDNIILLPSGTDALYTILSALDLDKRDEVIVQAFTCSEVPSAIIKSGATPIYTDISKDTLTSTIDDIKKVYCENTKVIIIQNTFGHVEDLLEIKNTFPEAFIIEDAAHACTEIQVDSNMLIADAAFFSTQHSKLYSTVSGGVLISKNELLRNKVLETLSKDKTSYKSSFKTKLHQAFYNYISQTRFFLDIRELTIKKYLFKDYTPSSSFPSLYSIKKGIREVLNIRNNLSHRKKVAQNYIDFIKEYKKTPLYKTTRRTNTYNLFPIRVHNKTRFLSTMKNSGFNLYDWPSRNSAHIKNNKRYHLKLEDIPNTIEMINEIVALPTDTGRSFTEYGKLIDALKKNQDYII